ncbi:MAG: NADH:ubiquinone oxidoreductase [Polyangia bacterium]|jgi:F420-non-reducing hydrogenase small subunit
MKGFLAGKMASQAHPITKDPTTTTDVPGMPDKPKLAVYWSASCGGCEIAVANLHEHLLEVATHFDFMFCPCLLDTKRRDIEALSDQAIAVTLFNGAIRTEENLAMARLLRRKSRLLVAMGACAASGGIPALANLCGRRDMLSAVYLESPSLDNPDRLIPREESKVAEGTLRLPQCLASVMPLGDAVGVDYAIPGCPPESDQLWQVIQALVATLHHGAPLPPHGSMLGAGKASVCDECDRKRSDKKIQGFRRVWEFVPDPEQCLLEQGLVCMGVATRGGCGGLCPKVNMPCIGCYGSPDGVYDQGAKLAATLGSILDIEPIRNQRGEAAINAQVDAAIAKAPDLAGTACKFTLASHQYGTDRADDEEISRS